MNYLVKSRTVTKKGEVRYNLQEISSNHEILNNCRYKSRQGRNDRVNRIIATTPKIKYKPISKKDYLALKLGK